MVWNWDHHRADVARFDERELELGVPPRVPRPDHLVLHWCMTPTHIDKRLLDRVIVAAPRRGVDVVMFPCDPADPKVDGPAAEEPIFFARLLVPR